MKVNQPNVGESTLYGVVALLAQDPLAVPDMQLDFPLPALVGRPSQDSTAQAFDTGCRLAYAAVIFLCLLNEVSSLAHGSKDLG